ncbi:MAG: MATE family efflux transporter [Holosporales bacterium]|jgi:MATE family multidrug resistance protein|nr:MATE family efflux transporter [Holosporales bacterium]
MEHKIIDSSFKSIFTVTIPILLSTLFSNICYVTDRFMLAGYSLDAMNAVMACGMFASVFSFLFIGVANTAEVYVGQYNGSKQYDKIAAPVWQMIYLSLLSILFFAPLAFFSDKINFLPSYFLKEGIGYQQIILKFLFFPVLTSSLSTFFIGQGKTKIVTIAVFTSGILNAILDYIFIYVFKPSLGSEGAAWATIIAEVFQIIIFASIFFSNKNRAIYKTFQNRSYNKELFFGCIKMGIPTSLNHFISILGWFLLQTMMNHVSKDCATIYSIGMTIYTIFIFVGESFQKAISTIAANMIGYKDLPAIKKTFKIFVILALVFCLFTAVPIGIFSKNIFDGLNSLNKNISHLYNDLYLVLILITICVAFDSILSITWGILIAGGDTRYPAIVNFSCTWGFVFLPAVLLYYFGKLTSAVTPYYLMLFWCTVCLFFIYRRYKSMKWYKYLV